MSDLSTRLKESRLKAGKSQAEVAEAVGIKQPTYQALESGKTQKSAYLPQIAKFLGVDAYWLQTGEGDSNHPLRPSEAVKKFMAGVKELRKIPVLDFVQAGSWREVVYDGLNPMGWTYSDYEGINPEEIFGVAVSGLSMSPRFMPGDQLVVDPNLAAQPGDFVIACNNDYEVTFKKYRVTGYDEESREQFQLVPLNPDFAPLDSKINNIRIIGVVVSHIQNFR
ncbi:S24 family peptidase [Acinetobacter lwoffii]|uniref:S24 family peptidase n=1 Tax=Acinetobacter lwoffii TaxID=28090 RepID=A0AAW8AY62_ACILW|nr:MULTISPECIES: S24 family peptidase [Acinetobacter]MDP1369223.1 S24 family peptidase [Acinetobacter lwoffii]MDP1388677.1 S24 family peptidase [Acinetobacter lwoffii]MDP1446333.1 S24 family peptidase [Acinetobacter lwoffii]